MPDVTPVYATLTLNTASMPDQKPFNKFSIRCVNDKFTSKPLTTFKLNFVKEYLKNLEIAVQ